MLDGELVSSEDSVENESPVTADIIAVGAGTLSDEAMGA